jgi:phage anti-repressor protein
MKNSDLCVDGKEIHKWLQVEMKFEDWIAKRIKEYNFKENQDFIIVNQRFFFLEEMGKELGMIEKNHKGKETRAYFLRQEKIVKEHVRKLESENNDLRKKLYSIEEIVDQFRSYIDNL